MCHLEVMDLSLDDGQKARASLDIWMMERAKSAVRDTLHRRRMCLCRRHRTHR